MDEFLILLQAKLDEAKSKGNINSDIDKIQSQIDKLKVQAEIDPKTISNLVKQLEGVLGQKIKIPNISIDSKVGQQIGNNIAQNVADGVSKTSNKVNAEIQKMANQINKIQFLSTGGIKNDYATQITKLEGNFRSLGLAQDTINTKTQNVKNTLDVLRAEFAKPLEERNFQLIQAENDRMQRELIESTNEIIRLQSSMKGMTTEQQRLNLANTIESWNQKNTAATKQVRAENERYIASLRDLSQTMTKIEFGRIQTGFKNAENSMRGLNKLGLALKDQWAQAVNSFKVWISASTAVMLLINKIREMPRTVKELDTALVDLKKTTTMTAKQLEDFYYSSNDIAKQMGVTTKEIIEQASAWSRLN